MGRVDLADHHLDDAIENRPVRRIAGGKAILLLDGIPICSMNLRIRKTVAYVRPCHEKGKLLIVGHVGLLEGLERIKLIAAGGNIIHYAKHLVTVLALDP